MKKRQVVFIVLAFLLTLSAGLIINLPVQQLFRIVQLPAEIRFSGLSGTITKAHAEQVAYKDFVQPDINARLNPWCLVKLALCYRVDSADETLDLLVDANLLTQSLNLGQGRVRLPKQIFEQFPQMLVKPAGEFELRIIELTLTRSETGPRVDALDAILDWHSAGIVGEDQQLGDYSARVSRKEGLLQVDLSDDGALLTLTGGVIIKPEGIYQMDLKLTAKPSLNPSVIGVLDMVSRKTGLNRFEIKRSGRLPANISSSLGMLLPAT